MGAFILQRFYYSLASGFIINLFVILNFYVLDKKDFLPRYIKFIKDISMPEILSVVIFIVAVIMVGIFIEGINESCFQYYGKIHGEEKAFVPKRRKPEEKRRTFIAFLLWHIFRRVGIVEACLSFAKKDEKDPFKKHSENPLYDFMCDHNYTNPNEAMLTCEKFIISKNIKSEVNMYKSFSFIIQLARVSFLLISIISFLAMITIVTLWGVDKIFWSIDIWEEFKDLFFFYLTGFLVSLFVVISATPMASGFGIRYVRDVGRWYKAIKISGEKIIIPNKGEKP